MLHLLGGASRSGKGIVAHRLLTELSTPYFCVDYFITAFAKSLPELGINHEQPAIARGETIWPKLEPMLANILWSEPRYLVDGDALLPKHVHVFAKEHPEQTRACFIGYTDIDPQEKLLHIRRHKGDINDWTGQFDDAHMLRHIHAMIEFSAYLQSECERYGLAYFDMSRDFLSTLEQAYGYLKDGGSYRTPASPFH